jgi:pectin methylesterase-like acyl-CoA thioesterase
MRCKLPLFLFMMAIVAVTSQNLFAANATVGSCAGPGIHYTTISAAVTAASPGAIISVCPGTYPEQVMIGKNLTLKGVVSGSNDAAVIVPPSGGIVANGTDVYGGSVAAQIFVQNSSAVTLSNLTVDGTGNNLAGCAAPTFEGIAFENSSGKITDNVVRNQYQTDFTDYGLQA